MEPRKQFAANLRATRDKLGLSQEEVGFRCGLHPTEISRLERAVREPRLSTMVRLARALDIQISELVRGIN